MSKEGDKRRAALVRYKILAGVFGVLSVGILICAGLAVKYYESSTGPAYFVGGFVVGSITLLMALVTVSVLVGAMGISFDDNKMKQLAPRISCQYSVSMLLLPACFVGCILVGIFGLTLSDEDDPNRETNKTLAIIMLVGCILVFCLNIVSMRTTCVYGVNFGVVINQRGRRTFVLTDSSVHGRASEEANGRSGAVIMNNNMNVFTTDGNRQHVSQLEQQNRLLQQQVALQQQMLIQQQQQQFSGGEYPPPPAYQDPAYPPVFPEASAPPPPYSKVV